MKKQILMIALISVFTVSVNSLKAQERPQGPPPQQEQVDVLTKAQTETVNKILSKYDSESVSETDAKAIMKAIRDAKIPGGKGVENAINAAGFSFEEIKKLAPPPARPNKRK